MLLATRIICFTILCLLTNITFAQNFPEKTYIIKFPGYKTNLSKTARSTLDSIAGILKKDTTFNCAVISNCNTEYEKFNVAMWDRVNNAVNYLVKQGINGERLIFKYGGEHTICNEITLAFTTDKLDLVPVPAPHPNLRRKGR